MTKNDFQMVDETTPGFVRSGSKGAFFYKNLSGDHITGKGQLKRIESLVIPPDWTDVWIAPHDQCHIQAYGYDRAGRKQYIYHPDYAAINQKEKFDELFPFGKMLPTLRYHLTKDLKRPEWDQKKVTALAISILDRHYLRVGSKRYAAQNGSYGLSTLCQKHLKDQGKHLKISYCAKGGKQRNIGINSKRFQHMIRDLSELPGEEVFQYINEYGHKVSLSSSHINDYIQEVEPLFTAKDFRTWGATSLAVKNFKKARKKVKSNKRLKLETTLVRLVAKRLGNKVSTCRDYYIHPDVLEHLVHRGLPSNVELQFHVKHKKHLRKHEAITLNILYKKT